MDDQKARSRESGSRRIKASTKREAKDQGSSIRDSLSQPPDSTILVRPIIDIPTSSNIFWAHLSRYSTQIPPHACRHYHFSFFGGFGGGGGPEVKLSVRSVLMASIATRAMRPQYSSFPGGDSSTQRFFTRAKLPLSWFMSRVSTIVPPRIRRTFRSTRSKIWSGHTPASSITTLRTSVNPANTLRSLRAHHWSYYDAQYLLLTMVGIFSLCVIQSPGLPARLAIAILLMTSLILPITQQFFLPFLPIAAWLIFFYGCQ